MIHRSTSTIVGSRRVAVGGGGSGGTGARTALALSLFVCGCVAVLLAVVRSSPSSTFDDVTVELSFAIRARTPLVRSLLRARRVPLPATVDSVLHPAAVCPRLSAAFTRDTATGAHATHQLNWWKATQRRRLTCTECFDGNCFDARSLPSQPADFRFHVYDDDLGVPVPQRGQRELLRALRRHPQHTADARLASVFVVALPTFDRDPRSPSFFAGNVTARLRRLPSWRRFSPSSCSSTTPTTASSAACRGGVNHIVVLGRLGTSPSFLPLPDFDADAAMLALSSPHPSVLRDNFDIALPHLPLDDDADDDSDDHHDNGKSTGDALLSAAARFSVRATFLSFSAVLDTDDDERAALVAQHDPDAGVLLVGQCGAHVCDQTRLSRDVEATRQCHSWCAMSEREFDMHADAAALTNSRFVAVLPERRRRGSAQLLRVILAGAIPVVIDDGLVLPFRSLIDWDNCAVRLSPRALFALDSDSATPSVAGMLRQLSDAEQANMRACLASATSAYLESYDAVARGIVDTLLLRAYARHFVRPATQRNLHTPPARDRAQSLAVQHPSYTLPYRGGVAHDWASSESISAVLLTYRRERVLAAALSVLSGVTTTDEYLAYVWNYTLPPSFPRIGANSTATFLWPREPSASSVLSSVVVVDNGGTLHAPQTLAMLAASVPRGQTALYVHNGERLNSLNSRFLPFPHLHTNAVMSLDDDLFLAPRSFDHGYAAWRDHARSSIAGWVPRNALPELVLDSDGDHGAARVLGSSYAQQTATNMVPLNALRSYRWQHEARRPVFQSMLGASMLLTGAAVFHSSFLERFWSIEHAPVREMINTWRNCEDIAMNMLISSSARATAPLLVAGLMEPLRFQVGPLAKASSRLSSRPSHFLERTSCLRLLIKHYGYCPLRYSPVVVNPWTTGTVRK